MKGTKNVQNNVMRLYRRAGMSIIKLIKSKARRRDMAATARFTINIRYIFKPLNCPLIFQRSI